MNTSIYSLNWSLGLKVVGITLLPGSLGCRNHTPSWQLSFVSENAI